MRREDIVYYFQIHVSLFVQGDTQVFKICKLAKQ